VEEFIENPGDQLLDFTIILFLDSWHYVAPYNLECIYNNGWRIF
jgi:hypothetical protein